MWRVSSIIQMLCEAVHVLMRRCINQSLKKFIRQLNLILNFSR